MGKYMRKSKSTGEVSLMDVSHHQSPLSLGVRTRAKTLALQRLGNKSTAVAPPSTPAGDGVSYLQLRSRRLEKPIILIEPKRRKQVPISPNLSSRARSDSVNSGSGRVNEEKNKSPDEGIEASFGENVVDFEGTERGTRETTPCSLIREPDTVRTPSSTTRPTSLADSTAHNSMRRHIPTTHEMDEFFSGAEDQQQKQFIEKYNFDPVNEKPLPGRYKWEKVDP